MCQWAKVLAIKVSLPKFEAQNLHKNPDAVTSSVIQTADKKVTWKGVGQLAWNKQHHSRNKKNPAQQGRQRHSSWKLSSDGHNVSTAVTCACAQAYLCMHTYTQIYPTNRYEHSWLCMSEQNKSMILGIFYLTNVSQKRSKILPVQSK